ncbi:MAG: response regulator [Blastocatellia bacterium]|nr:response regulator [Blastocatellia bacterium]
MQATISEATRAARVLVVDDERHIARFLEFVLKKAGYEVAVAHDGEQALARIEEFAPDAVLLDLVMPKLSGLDVLQQLRANPRHAGLFIAVLSARSFEERAGEVLEAGANLHCEKPVAPSSLLSELAGFGIAPRIARIPGISSEVAHEAV